MDDNIQGSYRFGSFQDNENELARLKQQASFFLNIEKKNLERAGLRPGHKVLDLGCGPGFISCELAKYVGDGKVWGVDINDSLLEFANKEKKERNIGNLTFHKADVYQLDLPEKEFDFVYCRLLIQHLPDPQLALQKIYSVLKPGGTVFIADIDDGYVLFYPEPKGFNALVQRTIANVKEQGGDRFIGRKLHSYLCAAGYRNVNEWVDVFTSSSMGMKNFIDLTCTIRVRLTASEEELKAAQKELKDIYTILDQPEAWGAVGSFFAAGTK